MHWQAKAAAMRFCAAVPRGDRLYSWGQKRFGRLWADPMERLPLQAEMLQWLAAGGVPVVDASFFEVGTGHVPLVPIGFFLAGARETVTVDLHRRVDWGLTRDCLGWMSAHRSAVEALYSGLVPRSVLDERLALLSALCDAPESFLSAAGIVYSAPTDAAHTGLPSESVDCYFSVTVLEHVSPPALPSLCREANRVLKRTGRAFHYIDLSDHFQHQDRSITRVNFLRFTAGRWQRLAGNEYAYCNRLRLRDYLQAFQAGGFEIDRLDAPVDQECLRSLQRGFPVTAEFRGYSFEELSVTTAKVMLVPTPVGSAGA